MYLKTTIVRSLMMAAFSVLSAKAFSADIWKEVQAGKMTSSSTRYIKPVKARYFEPDMTALRAELESCPKEQSGNIRKYGKIISLPMPDGQMARFAVASWDCMEPELAAKARDSPPDTLTPPEGADKWASVPAEMEVAAPLRICTSPPTPLGVAPTAPRVTLEAVEVRESTPGVVKAALVAPYRDRASVRARSARGPAPASRNTLVPPNPDRVPVGAARSSPAPPLPELRRAKWV